MRSELDNKTYYVRYTPGPWHWRVTYGELGDPQCFRSGPVVLIEEFGPSVTVEHIVLWAGERPVVFLPV